MRLIIIEDESIIRNGILRHVPWAQLGVDEVMTAARAEEAIALCEERQPDIIVSDIRMPGGLDGISCCRRLRELYRDVEIIFVTGYADKEYLKAAIDLHAAGYVEKPVKMEELSGKIEEAVRRVKETQKRKSSCLHSILLDVTSVSLNMNGDQVFQGGWLHLSDGRNIEKIRDNLSRNLCPMLEQKGIHFLSEIKDAATIIFLLGASEDIWEKERKDQFSRAVIESVEEDVKWFLAFGEIACGESRISATLKSAISRGEALAYLGWNQISFWNESEKEGKKYTPDKEKLLREFEEEVMAGRETGARSILNELYELLVKNHAVLNGDIRYLYRALNDVLVRAEKALGMEWEQTDGETEGYFVERAETFTQIHRCMTKRLTALFRREKVQDRTFLVKKVISYMRENYKENELSIRVLADHVGVTPNYLSNLFKKNTGITIGQYLTDIRVEKAKQLLENENLKLYQIALEVGYEDANYFAKLFKKKTGYAPSEYKESRILK